MIVRFVKPVVVESCRAWARTFFEESHRNGHHGPVIEINKYLKELIQMERDVFLPGEVVLTKKEDWLHGNEYENEQFVFDFNKQRVKFNERCGFYSTSFYVEITPTGTDADTWKLAAYYNARMLPLPDELIRLIQSYCTALTKDRFNKILRDLNTFGDRPFRSCQM